MAKNEGYFTSWGRGCGRQMMLRQLEQQAKHIRKSEVGRGPAFRYIPDDRDLWISRASDELGQRIWATICGGKRTVSLNEYLPEHLRKPVYYGGSRGRGKGFYAFDSEEDDNGL